MWYVCDELYAVLYVRVSCFVVRGCAVWRRYIHVCNCDMFSVVDVYLDHLKFCVLCIHGRRYVCCNECNVVCNEPYLSEVMYFWCVCFKGQLGFLNCVDICMCVVNKQFELLECLFDSVYVDLQFDEVLSLLLLGLCPCVVYVVVFCLSVKLSWYPMWMRWLL